MTQADAERVAAALLDAPPRAGATRVLAIDGRSGAGKSTFAHAVAGRLGAPVVDLEFIYPGWDGLEEGIRLLADDVLAPLSRGESAAVPRWDYAADDWGPPLTIAPAPVIIVEGVGAGAAPVMPYVSLLVWIELDLETRRERALARDGHLYQPHWDRWQRQEDALLAREQTAERADIVIGRPGPGA